MKTYCFQRCVYDILDNGKTAFEVRFGEGYKGPIYFMSCEIGCKPANKIDNPNLAFGSKTVRGIILGYDRKEAPQTTFFGLSIPIS